MGIKYQNRVILLSLTIMFYQALANTDLGVISQLAMQKGNNWAGPILTSLLFLGSGLGSLYNSYIGKYSYRVCIFIGSFGYTIFIAMGIVFMKFGFETWTLLLIFIGGAFGGMIASIFYNSTYNYVNYLAQQDEQPIKYFGINIGIVQFCNLFGNIISALLIQQLGQIIYVSGLDVAILLISCLFLAFSNTNINNNANNDANNNQNGNNIQKLNTSIQQIPTQQQDTQDNKLINPFKLWFIFGMTGVIVSFIYTNLSILIFDTFSQQMSQIQLNQLTFIIFIFEGIGEVLGGFFVIFYSFKQRSPIRPFLLMCVLFMVAVIIVYIGHIIKNQYLMGFGAIIVGISDCACLALALSIAGKWGKKGVTVFNLSQPLTICITGLLISFLSIEVVIVWISIYFLICSFSLYWYQKQQRNLSKYVQVE